MSKAVEPERRIKVLVVDDDESQLELRCMLVEQSGFIPVGAGGKVSACRLAAEHRPGVAVVDLGLPTLKEGLALIRELKTLDPKMGVIVLTGTRSASLDEYPEAALVDHLLIKPASMAELIRTLRSYQ